MRIEHIGDATLILADCMDIMRDMPDKAFDLAIVDPPYGINAHTFQPPSDSYRKRTKRNNSKRLNGGSGKLKNRILNTSNCGWDEKTPDADYFNELFRVSKNQIIWGGNYFSLSPSRCVLCWDKVQPWENFSQWEMGWTSFDSPSALFRYDNRQYSKIHPTEKPVALYKWLLSRYAKPGDTILDTHGGSGSSVIACLDMGYSITWIEKDEDYYNAALKRIKDFAAQPKLPMDDTPEPVEQWLGFEEEL